MEDLIMITWVTISCPVPFACVLPRFTRIETSVDSLEFINIVVVDNGNKGFNG